MSGSHDDRRVAISRPIYNEFDIQEINNNIQQKIPDEKQQSRLLRFFQDNECSSENIWRSISRNIPILMWLPYYHIGEDLFADVVSGITTGIARIPQAMAYAILAGLPAVYGLYTDFFAVLIYAIFGTSRHLSIGTWSIASIMTAVAVDNLLENNPNKSSPEEETKLRFQLVISLCLLVGIIQFTLGVLRQGFISTYLSEPFLEGFTTGAAMHVFASQFPKLFGHSSTKQTGPFSLIQDCLIFFGELSSSNTSAIVISLLSLIVLVLAAELNELQAKKGWFRVDGDKGKKLPLPTELVVVVSATIASYYGNFQTKYKLPVIGNVPKGLPTPSIPPIEYFSQLIGPAFVIAIVTFAISISIAKIHAKNHSYEVDSNQELIAYGASHIVSSFFHCFPSAAAMSRTAVQEGSGGRTQLASLFSSICLLLALLWFGPLMNALPQCVLSAIIVVALRGAFRLFGNLPNLWRASRVDFLIWIVSFNLVCFLDVELGLLGGIVLVLSTVIIRSQVPYCALIGRIPNTELYRAIHRSQGEQDGIKVFTTSSINFINVEHFKESLNKMVGVNLMHQKEKDKINEKSSLSSSKKFKKNYSSLPEEMTQLTSSKTRTRTHTVIIDCSMLGYIDVSGVKTLQTIIDDYKQINLRVIFANVKGPVLEALLRVSSVYGFGDIRFEHMYASVYDAVLACQQAPKTYSKDGSQIGERKP